MRLRRSRSALLCFTLYLTVAAAAWADGPSFADLLGRAKVQVAAGRVWTPADDNAMLTFQTMIDHLAEATPTQLMSSSISTISR